jgi:glutamine amidotransferase
MKIVIIDYGLGNLGSIRNMLKKIGGEGVISSKISDIQEAEKLILPGVGNFDQGMRNLEILGLLPILEDKVIQERTPILGICLGMQLFAHRSDEGKAKGLGWIDAEVVRFKFDDKGMHLKIPHMGWNLVRISHRNPLFEQMDPEPRFYFVHSYHVACRNAEEVLTQTFYGYEFASSVKRGNIYGVQFHPEKSHKFGMKLLDNYLRLC